MSDWEDDPTAAPSGVNAQSGGLVPEQVPLDWLSNEGDSGPTNAGQDHADWYSDERQSNGRETTNQVHQDWNSEDKGNQRNGGGYRGASDWGNRGHGNRPISSSSFASRKFDHAKQGGFQNRSSGDRSFNRERGGFGRSNDNNWDNQGGFRGGQRRFQGASRDWSNQPDRHGGNDDRRGRQHVPDEDGYEPEMYRGPKAAPYVPPEDGDAEALFDEGISTGINFEKYENIRCEVTGENPVNMVQTFEEAGLHRTLMRNVIKSNYKNPTPVQKRAIPIIKEGRDLMACAQTGSGKTAAFILPIIHRLLEEGFSTKTGSLPCFPEALIVSPTRELTKQIKDEARKFASKTEIRSYALYGATAMRETIQQLSKGVNILVCTPGRMIQMLHEGKVSLKFLKCFVLDEADRMLDQGFKGDIEEIARHHSMPDKEERQTLMFSATFPSDVQDLARDFLNNYLFLSVGIVGGACDDVSQSFFQVAKFDKRDKLMEILQSPDSANNKILVFVEKKKNADFLATYLCQNDLKTTSIHGDRLQEQRERAIDDFKTGRMPILVATAVAARGLDIQNVAHVINFDLPNMIEEYVHRIGRTGRIGNKGKATSFYDESVDGHLAKDLIKILGAAQQEVPDWLEKEAERNIFGSTPGFGDRRRTGGLGFGSRDNRKQFGGNEDLNGGFKAKTCFDDDEDWD